MSLVTFCLVLLYAYFMLFLSYRFLNMRFYQDLKKVEITPHLQTTI